MAEWYDPRTDEYLQFEMPSIEWVDRADDLPCIEILGPDGEVIVSIDPNPTVGFARFLDQ